MRARVVDLAKRLGVTHVTVNRTVARLQRGGFVSSQPYRAIFLTEKGRHLAGYRGARLSGIRGEARPAFAVHTRQ